MPQRTLPNLQRTSNQFQIRTECYPQRAEEGRGEGERLFNCTVPAKCSSNDLNNANPSQESPQAEWDRLSKPLDY
jgi:hypothetical protein